MVRYITNSKKEEVMVSKKELVLRAFRGEEVDRVPVGFWFHFVSQEEKMLGLDNPEIFNKSVRDMLLMFELHGQTLSRL